MGLIRILVDWIEIDFNFLKSFTIVDEKKHVRGEILLIKKKRINNRNLSLVLLN